MTHVSGGPPVKSSSLLETRYRISKAHTLPMSDHQHAQRCVQSPLLMKHEAERAVSPGRGQKRRDEWLIEGGSEGVERSGRGELGGPSLIQRRAGGRVFLGRRFTIHAPLSAARLKPLTKRSLWLGAKEGVCHSQTPSFLLLFNLSLILWLF